MEKAGFALLERVYFNGGIFIAAAVNILIGTYDVKFIFVDQQTPRFQRFGSCFAVGGQNDIVLLFQCFAVTGDPGAFFSFAGVGQTLFQR